MFKKMDFFTSAGRPCFRLKGDRVMINISIRNKSLLEIVFDSPCNRNCAMVEPMCLTLDFTGHPDPEIVIHDIVE